jgi:hypothetical protein
MASSWDVSYRYKRNDSWLTTQTTVKAETESTAIQIIKDKHSGCEVNITRIKRK